jgi:type II secretory pathway pseudopilin PulG
MPEEPGTAEQDQRRPPSRAGSALPFPGDDEARRWFWRDPSGTSLFLGGLAVFCVLVLALSLFALVLGPLAVMFGVFGLISRPRTAATARAMWPAIAGIVMGLSAASLAFPAANLFRFRQRLPVCAANLSAIGMALHEYQQQQGTYPPDLQVLIDSGLVTQGQCQCFLDPEWDESRPDYIYVTGLPADAPADWILAYELADYHEGRGGHILYVNGDVKHFRPEALQEEIKRFRDAHIAARGEPP